MRMLLFCAACGGAPAHVPVAAPPAPGTQACTSHHVHGVLRSSTSGEPLAGVQVSLGGGEGQDDAVTDDQGHYDLRSTAPDRDSLVIFYVDDNLTRKLSTARCDEDISLRIGIQTHAPGVM